LNFVSLVFQLLIFLFCLCSLGEPLRIFIRRFVGLFRDLDLLQLLILDVYLGGFVLYVIAIVPLHLFSSFVLYSTTLMAIAIVFLFHRKALMRILRSLKSGPRRPTFQGPHDLETALVILIISFSIVIQILPLSNLIYGSVRDTAIHSLFTQVIIENGQIPLTLRPYLAEGIVYPQGFTPMVAYAVLLFNYPPPEAVLYLTSFFNVLTVVGVYFLGKTLSRYGKWKMGLSLAFVFAFVAAWPKYITWGSNAFVASFPLYFVCLGFFPFLTKEKLSVTAIFTVGLLFGFLSVLHLQVYETLIISLFVLWLHLAIKREKGWLARFGHFAAISFVSMLVLSPFLVRQFSFYPYQYHNVGIPNDAALPTFQPSLSVVLTSINWLAENLSLDPLLKLCSFALVLVSILMIVVFHRRNSIIQTHGLLKLGIATLLGQLLIPLLAAIAPSDLPFYPQPIMLYISIYFFIAALNYPFYRFFYSRLSKRILTKATESGLKTRRLLVTAVSAMLLLGIYAPFLYRNIFLDVGGLYASYSVFGVTTEQDRQLIMWIKENVPKNATILINNFQSGTFIPSIANRKAVFPSFGSSGSISYQRLAASMERNTLNSATLDLMRRFNITDIYVGSGVSSWENGIHHWDPLLFLGNPRFSTMKNFGNAYLFHVNYTNTPIAFQDDFEHSNWYDNGWQAQYVGSGLGNVTISNDVAYLSSQSLKMSSRTVCIVSECGHTSCVLREIFMPENVNVSLAFFLRATEGFHGKDTFAVVITNVFRNQSMVLTTPHGVYDSYAYAKSLGGFEGMFDDDLSESWNHFFNASLPNPFILELTNWDFDGIENVAYIDNITVTAEPVS